MVILRLDALDLMRVAAACACLRHDNGVPETVELPTQSALVRALCKHAFPRDELVPRTRPIGGSESWVAYFSAARGSAAAVKRRPFRRAVFRTTACLWMRPEGCWRRAAEVSQQALVMVVTLNLGGRYGLGSGTKRGRWLCEHILALTFDGLVYSWGLNLLGQLGHGDRLERPSPTLMKGLEGVCHISSDGWSHSLAVSQSGGVFRWGKLPHLGGISDQDALRPVIVGGFGGVLARRVYASTGAQSSPLARTVSSSRGASAFARVSATRHGGPALGQAR
jgi:hypothetical protein